MFCSFTSAQSGTVYFKEEFNYASLDQMQAAGWTFTRPAGISVASSAVTLDGTGGDCAMHHSTSFSTDVLDWKAEVRSMWLGQGHSVLSVFVYTEHHSYGWAADGYYKEFSLYRDSKKILHFGNYAEKANEYVVLTMVRDGSTFSFYFNGALINTYREEDTVPSEVTGLGLVSPWKGNAKYDYYQVGEPSAVFAPSNPSDVTNSFPTVPVIIGVGVTAAVVGGVLVYYFFVAGHISGSTAGVGASTGAGSSAGSSGGEGGSGSNSGEGPGELGEILLHNPPDPIVGGSGGGGSSSDSEVGENVVSGASHGADGDEYINPPPGQEGNYTLHDPPEAKQIKPKPQPQPENTENSSSNSNQ